MGAGLIYYTQVYEAKQKLKTETLPCIYTESLRDKSIELEGPHALLSL